MATMDDFRKEVNAQISRAARQRRTHVEINAGELLRIVDPNNNRQPMACNALRQCMTGSDKIIFRHRKEPALR